MTDSVRVAVETGKKGKKAAAYAIDWPGWNRGGKSPEDAYTNWSGYRDRYRAIAERAGLLDEFDTQVGSDVVVTYEGTGSTDFWGISFAPSPLDIGPHPEEVIERRLTLLWACWDHFDDVAARVSPIMKKGPRGGGRDRDQIVSHVLANECSWAGGVGVDYSLESILDLDVRRQYRKDLANAIRTYNAEGKRAKTWEISFLLRHAAYHTMDHAWEMEDKDVTAVDDAP